SGALRHHLLAGPLAAEEDPVEVDADDGVPPVDRDVFGLGPERRASVVHHDVEPAELLRGPLDHRLDLVLLPHVHGHREGAPAEHAWSFASRSRARSTLTRGVLAIRRTSLSPVRLASAHAWSRWATNVTTRSTFASRYASHAPADAKRGHSPARTSSNSRAISPAARR